jgi:hypothetical protein
MKRGRGSDSDEGDDLVEIVCLILRKTPDGVKIETPEEDEVWLPRKYVDFYKDGVRIPEWLAMDRGLI